VDPRIALFVALSSVGLVAGTLAYAAQQETPPEKARSNQLLMRDKLSFATKALEGLSMENYDKIAEAGEMMGIISRAASWHVIPTAEYSRMSKNFQEQARDLQRHAKDKNLDAASLDYMRITLTCVQCHNYIRDHRAEKKD
jgi:hypothetical protein